MRIVRLVHVCDLLKGNETIRACMAQRQREVALLETVRARLPEPMRPHCLDVSLMDGRLTLFLDSPAWGTRARFIAENITESLLAEGIREIRIQIRPESPRDPAPPSRVAPGRGLTEGAVMHLRAAAEHMLDPDLASAFRRLAQRHAPPTRPEETD